MRLALIAIVASVTACVPRPVPPAPIPAVEANGAILSRGPCPLPASWADWLPELALQATDIEQAGLKTELAARPLTTLYPESEFLRLQAATAAGRCERVVYRSDGLAVVGYMFRPGGQPRRPFDQGWPRERQGGSRPTLDESPETRTRPDRGKRWRDPGETASSGATATELAGSSSVGAPVVMFARGGNGEFGRISTDLLLIFQALADAGYVVIGTQYRGVEGGGGADEFGGAEVGDLANLVPLARTLPGVDPDRMFLLGGSRGAMEGLIALREGLPVRAAAFLSGMYDLRGIFADRPGLRSVAVERVPNFAADESAQLTRRSAIEWAAEIETPLLLLHGRADWRVPLTQAEAFDAVLTMHGREHRLVVYDRDEHQLAFHRKEWVAEVVAWFAMHER